MQPVGEKCIHGSIPFEWGSCASFCFYLMPSKLPLPFNGGTIRGRQKKSLPGCPQERQNRPPKEHKNDGGADDSLINFDRTRVGILHLEEKMEHFPEESHHKLNCLMHTWVECTVSRWSVSEPGSILKVVIPVVATCTEISKCNGKLPATAGQFVALH